MADPIAQLQNYWIKVAADDADLEDLATAQRAMKNAIIAARYNLVERQRFAQAGIFTEALTKDLAGDGLVGIAVKMTAMWGDIDTQPVRVIMLDLIRAIATGTTWTVPKLEGGVVPWIASASASAPVFFKTLTSDPSDTALAAAISFLSEVSLPKVWGEYILRNDPDFDTISARIVRFGGTAKERSRLLTSATVARGEMISSLGRQEFQQIEASGAGEPTETMEPAKPAPWYKTRNASLALAGVLGAAAGAVYRLRK